MSSSTPSSSSPRAKYYVNTYTPTGERCIETFTPEKPAAPVHPDATE
ncbi:hypothetical protein [Streptomyces canus]